MKSTLTNLVFHILSITIWIVSTYAQQNQWEQMPNQGAGMRISELTVNTSTGDLYVVIDDSCLYIQKKGEDNWNRIRISDSVYYVSNIRFDNDGSIFIRAYSTDSLNGILKSTDMGGSWEKYFSNTFFKSFEVDEHGVIYVFGNGIFRKSAGSNQEEVISSNIDNVYADEIVFSAHSNGIFFAHTSRVNYPSVHYVSYDSCKTWMTISDTVSARIRIGNKLDSLYRTYNLGFPQSHLFINSEGVLFGAFGGNELIACFSYDTAKTWIAIDTFAMQSHSGGHKLRFFEGVDKRIHIIDSYNRKLYSSKGNFQNWEEVNLPEDYFFQPMRALFHNGNYYVYAGISLYKNTNIEDVNGWKICGPAIGYPRRMIEVGDGAMFVSWQYTDEPDGVFSSGTTYKYSADGQLSFVVDTQLHINKFSSGEYVTSFARDSIGGTLLGTHNQMLFRTSDNGSSWFGEELMTYSGFRNTHVAVSPSNTIFVAHLKFGISFTTDNGVTWQYYVEQNENKRIFSLCTNTHGYVFAGTQNAIYRLKEFDTVWTRCPNGLLGSVISALYSTKEGVVYAGGAYQGMYRSYDNGDNWEQINQGLDTMAVTDIVSDAEDNIYISTRNGVYVFDELSKTWKDISEKLSNRDVRCLLVSRDGSLYVGTNGDGLFQYKRNLYHIPSTRKIGSTPSIKVYPSITANVVNISIDEYDHPGTIHIYDCIGKPVADISHSGVVDITTFDASGLPPGLYHIRFFDYVKSFVVLK